MVNDSDKENVLITPIRKQRRSCFAKATPKSEGKLNLKGESKLHVAAIKNEIGSVEELLLDSGIDVNCKDHAGWTALHEACSRGHNEIVKALIKAGASVNIPGYENQTALMDAVISNRVETVQILLEAGADPNLHNEHGQTAYFLVVSDEMKTLLNECGQHSAEKSIIEKLDEMNSRPLSNIAIAYSSSIGMNDVASCSDLLDADVLMNDAVKATHLVVKSYENNMTERTLKYLEAMACGAWIVTSDWLHACKKAVAGLKNLHSL